MIRLMKNSFYNEASTKTALVDFITKATRFSMGEQCAQFEKNFAKWQGRQHALFVMNGSMANLVLIQSLMNMGHLSPGDKVGFSAVTWSTNIMPIIQLGLVPIPVDCEINTLNISSEELQKTIDSNPLKALFITNALGFASDIDKIAEICEANNIILIEDNCESLGSEIKGKKLGNFGLASTFSTFVGHHMSTIEGGIICTDDEELYAHLVMCRAHGWDRNLNPEQQQALRKKENVDDFFSTYTFHELAYNARPTEIQGFLGSIQLQYLDEIVAKREENFNRFQEALPLDKVFSIDVKHMSLVSNFAMPIICKNKEIFKDLTAKFRAAEIEIRPVIAGNMLRQPFYRKHVKESFELPNSNYIHDHGFYFGNHPDLTEAEINILAETLSSPL